MDQHQHRDKRSMRAFRVAAVRGMLWLGGERISGQIVDQVFTIILARLLLPGDFGLLAAAVFFTTLFRVFATMGLVSAIVQRKEIDDEYLSTAFWANLGAGVVLFLITVATSGLMGSFLGDPMVGVVVIVLSSRFLIVAGSGTSHALLYRELNFRTIAFRSVRAQFIAGCVGVVMAYAGMGVWSLVGQRVAATVTSTILLYRATRWRPKFQFSWAKFRDLWSFGALVLLARLFGTLVRNMDNLLIARYLGSVALGFYALAYAIFLLPLNDVDLIVNKVMYSTLSRLQDDGERLKRGLLLALQYASLVVLPIMVGLCLVASPMIEVVLGNKWLPATPVVRILALAGFLQFVTSLGPTSLKATGRTDLNLWWSFLSALFYLPAFAIGLRWGIVGVAVGYLTATCALIPIKYRLVARVTGVTGREVWDALRPSVVGSAVMAAVVAPMSWGLPTAGTPPILTLALLVTCGAALYGSIIWMIHRQAVIELLRMLRQAREPVYATASEM